MTDITENAKSQGPNFSGGREGHAPHLDKTGHDAFCPPIFCDKK